MSARPFASLSLAGAVLLTLAAPVLAQAPQGKRLALLVGVKDYDHSALSDLKHTENDVEELARLCEEGLGGKRKAEASTDVNGMFQVGIVYEDGRGVRKDRREALRWYRKAADRGDELARRAADRLAKELD